MEEMLQEEQKVYAEELKGTDWRYIKEASDLFLIHAYSHLFESHSEEVFADKNYTKRYSQFNLNLAVGIELLLKALLLKKGVEINLPLKNGTSGEIDPEKTISLRAAIDRLNKIFPHLSKTTLEELKNTLKLINLRRNNIAHCSKRSSDHYAYEYRFSYVILYIYEEFFHGENAELTDMLRKSIDRSRVTQGSDFKPLKIKPKSLRSKGL